MSTNRYPDDPVQKMRVLYRQAQQQLNNNQLNRITQQRMRKRYSYAAKQVQRKQANNDRNCIEELIFYRNKFHSLMVLIGESMRESYNKVRFETEVRNILRQNWQEGKSEKKQTLGKKGKQVVNGGIKQTSSEIIESEKGVKRNGERGLRTRDGKCNDNSNNNNNNSTARRSVSPLQQFFSAKQKQISQSKNLLTFKSVIPQSQNFNSKFLRQMKSMPKKSNHSQSRYRQRTPSKLVREDSRIRDLRIENEQLQRILAARERVTEGVQSRDSQINIGDVNKRRQQLQRQLHTQQLHNRQLKTNASQTLFNLHTISSSSPYNISPRRNNVNQISSKNIISNPSRRAMNYIDQQRQFINGKNSNENKSEMKNDSQMRSINANSQRSGKSGACSSIVEKYKQVYINSTPQILFQNQLIRVMVIRYPLKIHQTSSFTKYPNPQHLTPNQQRLQLLIINNASKIVNNNQLNIQLEYDYDKHFHHLETIRKTNSGYSKIADTARDIVYREVVKVRLVDREGYNEEIRVRVKAVFSYESQAKRSSIVNKLGNNKINDNFYIEVKLPVTFIEFSSKPFSHSQLHSSKTTKLTIKPNPLFDTLQHTYMNTNLPFLKSTNPKNIKQHAILYGRSYIHDKDNLQGKGTYLQSEISLAWFEKKETRYVSIETIEEWVYLLAYIFLDVEQEEEEFEREFRKPSMHVFFNLQNKQVFQ